MCVSFFFFFSSRRRHTRFDCDWSSDVCSSDLMVRFGAEDARARAQLAVSKDDGRAKIVPAENGVGRLELAEPFDRAWRRVGLVLDRVGFTVEDRDRSKGFYFVRY